MIHRIDKTLQKFKDKGLKVSKASEVKSHLGFCPSGSLLLDKVMGTRGYPIPKFIHVYGEPSSGKSLLSLMTAAKVTAAGYGVIHCDLENNYSHAQTNEWRERFGIDLDHVFDISGSQDAENVLDAVVTLLKQHPDYIRLVIVDSIGALTSSKTADKDIADGHIDDNPKLVARFCRLVNVSNTSATIFMIAHMGSTMNPHNPVMPKGGIAIRHWASLGLEVRGKALPESKNEWGFYSKLLMDIVVKKNKVANPGGIAKKLLFDFDTGGFNTLDELITLGIDTGQIGSKGSFLVVPETELKFHGREKAYEFFKTNEDWYNWLFQSVTGYKSFSEYSAL